MRDNFKLLNFHISVSGYFHLICCASCLLSFLLCFSGRASFIIQHHHTQNKRIFIGFCFLIKKKWKTIEVFPVFLFIFTIREMKRYEEEGVKRNVERCPIKRITLMHHNHQPQTTTQTTTTSSMYCI